MHNIYIDHAMCPSICSQLIMGHSIPRASELKQWDGEYAKSSTLVGAVASAALDNLRGFSDQNIVETTNQYCKDL